MIVYHSSNVIVARPRLVHQNRMHYLSGGGLIMDTKIGFIVYCIEEYKHAKGMTGKSVIELFNHYDVISYIRAYYEALHTTGRQYIVDDISAYIEARQGLPLPKADEDLTEQNL